MIVISGKCVSSGAAVGKIRFLGGCVKEPEFHHVSDVEEETARFVKAKSFAVCELKNLARKAKLNAGREEADIFEAQSALLCDPDFNGFVEKHIREAHANAEFAVFQAEKSFGESISQTDEYFRERLADLKDISSRLLGILEGSGRAPAGIHGNEAYIICADDLTPCDTMLLDRKNILAFVTRKGSANSHTAILARTMQIPAVIGAEGLLESWEGMTAAVDAFEGKIFIAPDRRTIDDMNEKQQAFDEKKRLEKALIGKENVTLDGRRIDIFANAASLNDIDLASKNDAGGIGLLRSELLFLHNCRLPTEEEQFAVYKAAVLKLSGKPLIVRTLDLGSDKRGKCFDLPKEDNPALGWRGIRISLDRPDILRVQFRALCRASAFGKIMIMLPMITMAEELKTAKRILCWAKRELETEGVDFSFDIPLGIMIETPAAALISDILATEADFFSIGTNDLTQYVLAADRQNPRLDRFNGSHPAVMKLIELTVNNARKNGIKCGICGELAADPKFTQAFLEIGADELSVAPGKILEIRKQVRETKISITKEDGYENQTYRYGS